MVDDPKQPKYKEKIAILRNFKQKHQALIRKDYEAAI